MSNYQKYKNSIDKAVSKYQKENIKRVVIKLNKKTDKDIIKHLSLKENITGYLKQLIRKDIGGK